MKKILVVEDEPILCEIICDGLTQAGYAVDFALDGITARNKYFAEPKPDLVLLDLKLPDVSGLVLLDEFHAADAKPTIIICSAYGTDQVSQDQWKSKARGYIVKPVDIQTLINKIEIILNQ